jgi:NADH-quinone oxidoreductase subunit M
MVALLTTVFTFIALASDLGSASITPIRASSSSKKATGSAGITYHMGVDGISMLFVMLTTFLMPICILASWEFDPSASRNT